MLHALIGSLLIATAAAGAVCNAGAPAGKDLCSKIPVIGRGGWPVDWPLPLLHNMSAKTSSGSAIVLNNITAKKVWIGSCSLMGTKQNLTAALDSAGMELQAIASGGYSGSVQATVELGKSFVQVLNCTKPDPSHSGKLHGKAHAEGDTLASSLELAVLPEIVWSPASEVFDAPALDLEPWLIHLAQLARPVLEGMMAHGAVPLDWCSAMAPVMGKAIQCTSDKVCDLEPIAKKFVSLPYHVPLYDAWSAKLEVYADNPVITEIITPSCSAKTSLPLNADINANGLQAVMQISVRAHVCVLWFICHDLHPTTFATVTLPGDFAASVSQPDGLGSVRVSQSLLEFSVDVKWDELESGVNAGSPTSDQLQACMKTLTKDNTTACDSLVLAATQEAMAAELGRGQLGVGLRSSIVAFTGLQVDSAPVPPAGVNISEITVASLAAPSEVFV